MSDIAFATLSELALGLAEGRHSSVELAKHFLDRIGRANQALHAYVSVDADSTLRLAEAADARRRAGYGLLGPLDGVPVAIKDLCDIEGQIATAGSQAWRQRRGTTTSTAVARLLAGGMVPLGKLHGRVRLRRLGHQSRDGHAAQPLGSETRAHSGRLVQRLRAWPWPPAWRPPRWAPIPAARCVSRRRSTASPA